MAYKHAIIGYGGMGSWHHKNITERVPEIEVVGAYDVREEAVEELKKNGLKAYASLEELLADQELDLVTIATPNDFHREIAIRCLESGKNVVCEKPVTLTSKDLEEIIAVSEKTGKLFSVHQNRRWDKDYVIIKKILSDGTIGKPYFIENRVQGSRRSLHGWRGHKLNGGGMVFDWGVHMIDQLLNLIDSPVVSVSAQLKYIYSKEVDDNFKTEFEFENGVSALVEIATNCFINLPRWHVSCDDGTAVVENWACDGKIVTLNTQEEMVWDNDIVYTEAGPTRTMAPRPQQTVQELPLPEVTSDWADYYRNIVGVLDGKAELIVKPEQALRVIRLIEAIFESAEKGVGIRCHI